MACSRRKRRLVSRWHSDERFLEVAQKVCPFAMSLSLNLNKGFWVSIKLERFSEQPEKGCRKAAAKALIKDARGDRLPAEQKRGRAR